MNSTVIIPNPEPDNILDVLKDIADALWSIEEQLNYLTESAQYMSGECAIMGRDYKKDPLTPSELSQFMREFRAAAPRKTPLQNTHPT